VQATAPAPFSPANHETNKQPPTAQPCRAGKRRCGARSVGIKRLLSSHRAQADPARQRHAVRRPQRAGACDIIVQQTTSERNVQHTTSNMENNSATGPTLLRQIPLHCCAVETVAAAVREGRRMPQTRRCRLHLPIPPTGPRRSVLLRWLQCAICGLAVTRCDMCVCHGCCTVAYSTAGLAPPLKA
jgi:hypothetical protein